MLPPMLTSQISQIVRDLKLLKDKIVTPLGKKQPKELSMLIHGVKSVVTPDQITQLNAWLGRTYGDEAASSLTTKLRSPLEHTKPASTGSIKGKANMTERILK